VEWIENEFAKMLPKDAGAVSISEFKKDVGKLQQQSKSVSPWEWTFGGSVVDHDYNHAGANNFLPLSLKRVGGRFKDADLAKILQEATQEVAGAFKARGTPECMRLVEVLGIMQSRQWGTCSVCFPVYHPLYNSLICS
jgi:hypothetical protein